MAGAGYLVYRYYSDLSAVRGLNAEIAAVKARSEDLGDSLKDAKRIQTRLRAIGGLLENRRIDSPLFVFLEKHVQANVTFSGLAAGENNAVSLTAVSGSFEDYAAQIDELKAQKEIKSVTTSGLNVRYDEQDRLAAVDFSLTVAFDPAFFKPAK
jgi:Tfp pilus assembly protein PilN